MTRQWTEEQKKEWGEKMKAAREAAKDVIVELDVTGENLISEADLIERIRRMFDDAELPEVIKVNSKQLLEILDPSERFSDFSIYSSPFADHEVIVIPAKELL